MGYNLRNSNKGRQHEINHEPEPKNRKTIGIEVDTTDTDAITNICNELIDQIFDFLDPQSLLNVAGSCKRLQIAAAAKYARKFGRYTVMLYPKENFVDDSPKHGTKFKKVEVAVYGFTALPFLRCFGAQISNIHVSRTDNSHVIRYINQYCADTLIEMRFYEFAEESFTLENCSKPFRMIEKLTIFGLNSNQFSNFSYWFPSLRKLFISTERFDFDISTAVFPYMEELFLGEEKKIESKSQKRQMKRFVRANQQVRCLEIYIQNPSFSDVLEMISGNTLISKLVVRDLQYNTKCVKRHLLMRFARKHCELVELDFFAFFLKADDVIALILKLDSLKYFRCLLKDRAEYHYLVNQLQKVIGFMFEAHLTNISTVTIVELKFIR